MSVHPFPSTVRPLASYQRYSPAGSFTAMAGSSRSMAVPISAARAEAGTRHASTAFSTADAIRGEANAFMILTSVGDMTECSETVGLGTPFARGRLDVRDWLGWQPSMTFVPSVPGQLNLCLQQIPNDVLYRELRSLREKLGDTREQDERHCDHERKPRTGLLGTDPHGNELR